MNHLRSITTSAILGAAVLLGASSASAQVVTRENPSYLTGSDTLNDVMDYLLTELKATGAVSPNGSGGVDVYDGVGSSAGERQMEGSPSSTEDTCTPNDGDGLPENNPGCQEISPMSRAMDNSICEDDQAATNAEGLQVCQDGLSVIAKNGDHCPGGDGGVRTQGTLPGTSYVLGSGNFTGANAWKDVLRILYTGFLNTAAVPSSGSDRVARCSSPERQALIDNWHMLFEGGGAGCAAGCSNVVRALRRDDSSGTTQVFLEILGVAVNLPQRTSLTTFGGGCSTVPQNFAFCDGGENEVIYPTGASCATGGDPIKTACCAGEDLCGSDGTMGVVMAVRSPLADTALAFPANQCTRGAFARVQFIATSEPVCPDGTSPSAGRCRLPYYNNNGVRDFNCLNPIASQPPQLAAGSVDGRAYNFIARTSAGQVLYTQGSYPEAATWRLDMAAIRNSFPYAAGPYTAAQLRCQQSSATTLISCIVAQPDCCTIGWAGREAALIEPYATAHEALDINGFGITDAEIQTQQYPFWRWLYVNAINGFENITTDCVAAGHDIDYCEDQVAIAEAFYDVNNYQPGGLVHTACADAGFIPAATPICEGTAVTAGCGRPASQPLSACAPQ